ncbi:mRNA splicing protein [Coemansia javaensis]|uniref:Pre-mRNA-processing protein 45 n=1 Tax=Coemansia javaensis TaxID=2761396 RepID=A0A9W8HFU6_9FUNG|nr:mRNA splicing protein [Coemansia javaensis]
MSSIAQFLPEPKNAPASPRRSRQPDAAAGDDAVAPAAGAAIPPYGQRRGWAPKALSDFGDGGAYPEVHLLQFPLGMGRGGGRRGNALAKHVDGDGNVSYDALARHGRRENEVVQSQPRDLIPLRQRRDFDDTQDAIPERPTADAVRAAAERTRAALDKKLAARATPQQGPGARGGGRAEPTYVRYTPNQQGAGFNSGAAQRIVRVSDMPVDPMAPPKIRLQKQAQAPPSPPAPVMHSPPRRLTAEEQREWAIPPCVSNWKNIHGFTVSLDKRLAADGRGSEQLAVSDNFARLSEALISAEAHARREIAERAKIQQSLARREKEAKEERLRLLAQKAREERAAASAGVPRGGPSGGGYEPPPMDSAPAAGPGPLENSPPKGPAAAGRSPPPPPPPARRPGRMGAADFFEDRERRRSRSRSRSRSPASDADGGAARRDEVRRERRRQHERELRQSRGAHGRPQRTAESRDISEKIALGIARPTAAREGLFDSRLFNQPSASNAALQNDEAYNLYDKPLFGAAASSSSNYRPRANGGGDDDDDGRAAEVGRMMDSGRFGSALRGQQQQHQQQQQQSARPSGPVAFERGDVFGIDAFADSARQAKDGGDRR